MHDNKYIRDPVHGLIRIERDWVLRLINTRAFQRLRRIKQLGFTSLVYPGAEHTRFLHALGTHHLAGRYTEEIDRRMAAMGLGTPYAAHAELLAAGALLHDLGHGPLSHMFEATLEELAAAHGGPCPTPIDHEAWTCRVLREDPQVAAILEEVRPGFAEELVKLLTTREHPPYVHHLLNSQLDVDRFDYLLRDSYMTGAVYGNFDAEWILRNMIVTDPPAGFAGTGPILAVDARRGMSALEQYLLGRHYMYQHVYYHRTIRAAEAMARAILRRAGDLLRGGHMDLPASGWRSRQGSLGIDASAPRGGAFAKFARGEGVRVSEYLELDDLLIFSWFEHWAERAEDTILRDLSARLVNRELFATAGAPADPEHYATKKRHLAALLESRLGQERPCDYYLLVDDSSSLVYENLFQRMRTGAAPLEIFVRDEDGRTRLLSEFEESVVVRGTGALSMRERRWCFPKEFAAEARGILEA